jgi:hypothetical protein
MKLSVGGSAVRSARSWAVILASVALTGCSSSSTPLGAGGTGGTSLGGAGGASLTGAGGGAGGASSNVDSGSDGPPVLPAGWVGETPPDLACSGQADAAVECDLPPSTCALRDSCDAGVASCVSGSAWIVYYENPRCVAGRCVWDQEYFRCATGLCLYGACASIGTT